MKEIQKWQWALLIAYACGKIKGKTRYHKIAFAITKLTKGIDELGYFDDWDPKDYGAFSRDLQTEIDNLRRSGLVITYTSKDGSYEIFEPSQEAKDELKDVLPYVKEYISAIQKLNDAYSDVSLDEFLHGMYTRFPEIATKSKIKGRIAAADYVLRQKEIKTKEQVLEDYDARLKLSKMIGLQHIPKHNPRALYELAGISDKRIKLKTVDVVELVSETRNTDS